MLDHDDQQHVDLFHYSINAGFQDRFVQILFCWDAPMSAFPFSMLMVSNFQLLEGWLMLVLHVNQLLYSGVVILLLLSMFCLSVVPTPDCL